MGARPSGPPGLTHHGGMPQDPVNDVSWAVDETWPYLEPLEVGATAPTTCADAIFSAAWAAHHEELHVFLVRQVRDDEVAADLLQETYLRFMQQVRTGVVPGNGRAWLYRVAANLAVSRARRVGVAVRGLLRIRGQVARTEPEDPPDVTAIAHETRRELREALSGLAPDARAALLLAAEGFSGPEIASLIGRTEMATRTLMCRARRQVRGRLEREEASA